MTSTARTGRRRRMLHEGAAASPTTPSAGGEPQAVTHRRYTPREGSVSFAVASSLLPRSPLSVLAIGAAGAAAIAGLVWADGYAAVAAVGEIPTATAQLLHIDQPGGLARWYEGSLWLAVAVQSVLLFGMRKHRTDDTGTAYRWWLLVAGVAIGMSVSAATQVHSAVAQQLASLTGFSPMPLDAFWWFVPGGVLLSAVAIRSLMEMKESRIAALAGAAAVATTAVSWTASAGLIPAAVAGMVPALASPLVAPVASLAGGTLALYALLGYSRRIVRETLGELSPPKPAAKPTPEESEEADAQGTAPAKKPTKRASKAEQKLKVAERTRQDEEPQDEPELVPTAAQRRAERKRAAAAAKKQETDDRWTSGPEGDDDYGDDGPARRKLTKAERKRLRREKERHAA